MSLFFFLFFRQVCSLCGIVKKEKRRTRLLKNLWRTVRFFDMNSWVLLAWICSSSGFCTADNSSQILKERIGLLAFATTTFNERNSGNGDFRFEYMKTKFDFYRFSSLAGWKWLASVRQEKKLDELTLGFFGICSLAGWKWLANKLDEKTKKIQTHWQPEKRENPFRAVVKVLKRKKIDFVSVFRLSFSSFNLSFSTLKLSENRNTKTKNFSFYSLICA